MYILKNFINFVLNTLDLFKKHACRVKFKILQALSFYFLILKFLYETKPCKRLFWTAPIKTICIKTIFFIIFDNSGLPTILSISNPKLEHIENSNCYSASVEIRFAISSWHMPLSYWSDWHYRSLIIKFALNLVCSVLHDRPSFVLE